MYCFRVDCNKYLSMSKSCRKNNKIFKAKTEKKGRNFLKDKYNINYHHDYSITIEVNKANHHTSKEVFLDMKDKVHKK
jgi:hypothetical protein